MFCLGKPTKKDETFKDERKRVDQSGIPPKADSGMPRSTPGNRGHPMNAPPVVPAGGYGSHKDIKLTLLNKVATCIKIIFFNSIATKWLTFFSPSPIHL